MKKLSGKILFLVFGLVCFSLNVLADPPGPPDPGGNPVGTGGIPVGAPVDQGIYVLILLGIGYGLWKLYSMRKEKAEDTAD